MSGLPWFRFYPSDWLGGTRGLSATETGVYITLIAMMYDRGSPIPTNIPRLAQQCGASPARFEKAVETLLESGKIVLTEEGYWNQRVQKETELVSKMKTNASVAASQRWEKQKQNQRSEDSSAMREQCDRNANQKPDTRYQNQTPATPNGVSPPQARKRGNRVDGFEPEIATAVEMGLTPERARLQSEKFLDYWRAKPGKDGVKLDWPATWRNWVRSEVERHGAGPPGGNVRSFAAPSRPPTPLEVIQANRRAREATA